MDHGKEGAPVVAHLADLRRDGRPAASARVGRRAVRCPIYLADCRQGCHPAPGPDCLALLERCREDAAAAGTTLEALRASPRFEEWVFETAASDSGGWA